MNEPSRVTSLPNGVPDGKLGAADRSAILADLIDRLSGRVQAGEVLDPDAVAEEFPDFADDLRRLKQVLETGEVLVSDAVLNGHRVRQRPAQPSADPVLVEA